MKSGRKAPLVSVIIPAYDAARFISRALDSVMSQTYPNIEIVVVDDGSEDETTKVVVEYAVKHGKEGRRFLMASHIENLGASAARNTAIRMAHGEHIAILDHDDYWAPQRLGTMIPVMNSLPPRSFLADDVHCIEEDAKGPWTSLFNSRGIKGDGTLVSLEAFVQRDLGPMQPVFRRSELIEHPYDEDLKGGEDYDLYFRLLYDGFNLFLIERPMYFWVKNRASLSHSYSRHKAECLKFTEKLLSLNGLSPKVRELLEKRRKRDLHQLRMYLIVEPLRAGKYAKAFENFRTHFSLGVFICFLADAVSSLRSRFKRARARRDGSGLGEAK